VSHPARRWLAHPCPLKGHSTQYVSHRRGERDFIAECRAALDRRGPRSAAVDRARPALAAPSSLLLPVAADTRRCGVRWRWTVQHWISKPNRGGAQWRPRREQNDRSAMTRVHQCTSGRGDLRDDRPSVDDARRAAESSRLSRRGARAVPTDGPNRAGVNA
jgi:hypothetical protein